MKKQKVVKQGAFRRWKSGKVWLFVAAATVTGISGSLLNVQAQADITREVQSSQASTPQSAASSYLSEGAISSSASQVQVSAAQTVSEILSSALPQTETLANLSSTAITSAASQLASTSIASSSVSASSLTVQDTSLPLNGVWSAKDNFIGGKDSSGNPISPANIKVSGNVNTAVSGVYVVTYAYTDPISKLTTRSSATITISTSANSPKSQTPTNSSANVGSLSLQNISINQGSIWSPKDNFVNAVDSTGSPITTGLYTQGTVNTAIPGDYEITYLYLDSSTGHLVRNTASVLVLSGSSSASLVNAQLAVDQASAAVSSYTTSLAQLESQLSALPGSVSALSFASTSNYPSSDTVVLLAPSSAFVPDVAQINSYFLQYVNELRESNGQPDLSYSASEQAFAQTRAQQIVTDFSHDLANGSTEDIAASGNVISQMKSNQEIAYYMVMDWYDETDNPESLGAGHYGHRANLLYGGPSMGIGFVQLSAPNSQGYDEYHAFEAPQYTNVALYNKAIALSNSLTDPATIPLPALTFKYVDGTQYQQITQEISAAEAALSAAKTELTQAESTLLALQKGYSVI